MGVVGNHEKAQNFSHWRTRFFGYTELAKQTGSESPLWYSYEHGLVHFIQFSTEVFTWGGGSIPSMYAWMEADLARVDRERTPWVIAVGHKTPWMDTVRYDGLDPILRKGGVDLLLAGHAHNYQVVYPTDTPLESAKPELSCFDEATRTFKDCSSYVTCVMGSPGNREIEAHPDTTLPPAQILNKHSFMYGYGHMTVIDRTTLLLQWEETGQRNLSTGLLDRKAEAFWDEFRIVRTRPM
jgi:acid phosphatase type 7